ncbi:MAG: PAS domain-containing protein, partial [Kovacikia sp.]
MGSWTVRVLLVEADEEDYFVTRDLLSQIKRVRLDLERVATYEAALEVIPSHQHDVYLVNYRLGQSEQLKVLQAAILKDSRSPIILLTDNINAEVERVAMQPGVADYLVKGQMNAPLLERSVCYAIERHQTLEVLQERESQLEEILGSLKDVVWSAAAPTFEMLYVSPAVHSVYGRSAKEFFENPDLWLEVVLADDRNWVKQAFQAFLETGSRDLEYRI